VEVKKYKKGKSDLEFVVNKVVKCMAFSKNKEKNGMKIQKWGEGKVFPWFVTLSITCVHILLKHLHSYCLNSQFIHFPLK